MVIRRSLKKFQKLHTDKDFRRVYIEGMFTPSGFFDAYYVATKNKCNRVGIVVMSRHLKKASDRVRVKRWLREIFRTLNPFLKQGYDFVLKSKIVDASAVDYHGIENDLKTICRNAGIFSE